MARDWKLPEAIVNHLEKQHTETSLTEASSDVDRLSAISYLVGSVRLAGHLTVDDSEPSISQYAVTLGLNPEVLSTCYEHAAETYREMGQLLSDTMPEDLDVTDLLGEANAHLTATVEAEREQATKKQAHLEDALGSYRERAARDPLTGILNRGALNDALENSLEEAANGEKPIAVLFLDIDNFKSLNDTFGHQAGDEVLRGVAATLQDQVKHAAVVGRYGGEEFLLVVSGLTESAAEEFAASVVAAVRGRSYACLGISEPVTCSLGAVWGVPQSGMAIEQLVQTADELMYEAKRQGKDGYCFRAIGVADHAELPQSDGGAIGACLEVLDEAAAQTSAAEVAPEQFRQIAKELNCCMPQQLLDLRKQSRKELIVPCRLTTLAGGTLELTTDDAYVRNISTGGIGLLASRRILRGHAAEIAIYWGGEPRLYVAGLVAFCRHVEDTIHEVGLQLFSHANQPILSQDPISAIRALDWVANALRSLQPATLETV